MTFLATWGCASDFLKILPKFKIAARGQLQKILWAQKLKVRNCSNFTITFPTIWRCAGDIFKVLLKFKMATTANLNFLGGAQKLKKLVSSIFFQFQHYMPSNCGCVIDFSKMLPKFIMAARSQLQNFLWAQKL